MISSVYSAGVSPNDTQNIPREADEFPILDRNTPQIQSPSHSQDHYPTRHECHSKETSRAGHPVQYANASSILTIEPIDEPAKIAFDILVNRMKHNEIDPHHFRHIVISGEKDILAAGGYVSSATDGSDGLKGDGDGSTRYFGFYRIGFDTPPLSRGPRWTIGRGTTNAKKDQAQSVLKPEGTSDRGVDILLAFPHVPRAIKLHRMHAIIRLHPISGAWMLAAGTSCRDRKEMAVGQRPSMETCSHEVIRLENEPLRHFEERCLSNAQSTLSIGGMTFSVQFCVNNTVQEGSYLRLRNEFLAATSTPIPSISKISGIPFKSDFRNHLAVWREPINNGRFGMVFQGFDPHKGDLRAIKKWQFMRNTDTSDVMKEINVSLQLASARNTEGIVRTFGWCNSQGESTCSSPPCEFFMVMECGRSFCGLAWEENAAAAEWEERKLLAKQLLTGVQTIHAQGWIHGDITPMNILYWPPTPSSPSRAKLCDFGKMMLTSTETETRLAAWQFLAPEILTPKLGRRPYSQKIDVWGLGLALVYTWFPQVVDTEASMRDIGTWHSAMMKLGQRTADTQGLSALVTRTLSRYPANRPTAAEALAHECLDRVRQISSEEQTVELTDTEFTKHGKRMQ